MSSYTKATNFATKDTLPTGDSNKIVKGTEIDNEFNAISGAISSKADTASPTFTGTPAAPTASTGTSTTQLATTAFVTAALAAIYPVGSIYINAAVSTNPNTLLGFGTWTAFGAGKVIVGLDAADALFDTLEETGGTKNTVLPAHTHTATSTVTDAGHVHSAPSGYSFMGVPNVGQSGRTDGSQAANFDNTATATTGITVATTNASTGTGDGTNANVQPYIVVRMWKRTA
jgi:hypothetical protein